MGFIDKLQSKKGKKFMGYLYGWGASIVIVGAMFKIQHWPGASAMLVGGLSIEAIIFFFSAFEPIHPHDDWGLVYPELRGEFAHGHDPDVYEKIAEQKKKEMGMGGGGSGDPVSQQLDKMLKEANIGPELIDSLGKGMSKLGDQASKLSNIADASVATQEYANKMKDATGSLGKLEESYVKASEAISGLSSANLDGKVYGEQLQAVSKNLGALNAVYELQLQESNNNLKVSAQMYSNISQLITNLNESVDDTKKYKEQVGQLAANLTALNTVYGNMLSAMNFNK